MCKSDGLRIGTIFIFISSIPSPGKGLNLSSSIDNRPHQFYCTAMEKFNTLHEMFETAFDEIAASSWDADITPDIIGQPVFDSIDTDTSTCCSGNCMKCDTRYLYA